MLAKVDSKIYGIALVTTDGKINTAGDLKSEVSIQSISKVFTMAKVIEEQGLDAIPRTIGVNATGMQFNSIVAVEWAVKLRGGPEINPLVNPGAITATSMLGGTTRDEIWKSLLAFYSDFAGRPLSVNAEVFKSESDTNQRNQAIGHLMYAYEFIKSDPMRATDIYTEQCSGKWYYRTGLPAESGVGGGIIAVTPGKFGIAVISPPLDDAGNSVRAQKAIADIVNALKANPLASTPR